MKVNNNDWKQEEEKNKVEQEKGRRKAKRKIRSKETKKKKTFSKRFNCFFFPVMGSTTWNIPTVIQPLCAEHTLIHSNIQSIFFCLFLSFSLWSIFPFFGFFVCSLLLFHIFFSVFGSPSSTHGFLDLSGSLSFLNFFFVGGDRGSKKEILETEFGDLHQFDFRPIDEYCKENGILEGKWWHHSKIKHYEEFEEFENRSE